MNHASSTIKKMVSKVFRNMAGIAAECELNLLRLIPGCFWTELSSWCKPASLNTDCNLPMHKMTNTDLSSILKSEEVQRALRTQIKAKLLKLKKKPGKNGAPAKPKI